MADAEKLLPGDKLYEGYPKINKAIDNANEALSKSIEITSVSENAINTSSEAKTQATNTQKQLDTIVIRGDSSVEAAQARTNEEGITFNTLRVRLNDIFAMKLR